VEGIRRSSDVMKRSADRILVTHAGALPRSEELRELIFARADGLPHDEARRSTMLREAVAAAVRKQIGCGIDVVNDGELGKTNFTNYVRERVSGFEHREKVPGEHRTAHSISARDETEFAEYFKQVGGGFRNRSPRLNLVCTGELRYIGHADLAEDLANFRAALVGVDVAGAFLNANTPGTIEHWLTNEYYPSQEAMLYAIAECMRVEYNAIVEAGFDLHVDNPDLPDAWQMYPDMSVDEYRTYAKLRVDVLNHALRDVPRERITLHCCWGSFHGPHKFDIPLEHIADIIFSVKASRYSIEASNPAHEHEWSVFKNVKLPDGAMLVPGVVGHCTNFIENPKLVAERLERYANLVGKENVMAGTDCGIGPRVGHADICWAKFESMRDGAALASQALWRT
jgi:5-methyltetrahydropteroyltriglutamate--homocysteine methyltransferase